MARGWLEKQRRHFDREFNEYSTMYAVETPFHIAMIDHLFAFARPRKGERVLDLGCGIGRVSIPLLRAGCRVTALDISRPILEKLSRRVKHLGLDDDFEPLCIPAEHLDHVDRFELIVGRGFLHHVETPVEVLSRVYNAVVPGGRAVFMDPNPIQPAWIPFHLFHPVLSLSLERYLWRGFPAWTKREVCRAGFENVSCRFAGIVPPLLWDRLKWAADIEHALLAIPAIKRLALYLLARGYKPGGKP